MSHLTQKDYEHRLEMEKQRNLNTYNDLKKATRSTKHHKNKSGQRKVSIVYIYLFNFYVHQYKNNNIKNMYSEKIE